MCIIVNNNGVMRACYSEKEVKLALHKEEMGCYFNYQEFQRKFRELMNKPVYNAPVKICGCQVSLYCYIGY